ncbi:alpha/beta fold hydrolase [Pseudonocardia sp. GCM10023141]|uniref:alpha/beta fold hydrolase n=1 Tax=Pseudonocardia sp. GCM10023141 TaxID=3252653 RepID=UPI003622D8A3
MLLLHGLGGDREQALRLIPVADRHTRIAAEMPGHGDTSIEDGEPITFAHFAELTADLLDHLVAAGRIPSEPIPVVGVSMGAGVALALAAARRDLVQRLVLIRPSWLVRTPAANLAPFQAIAELLHEFEAEAAERAFAASAMWAAIEREAPAMAGSLLAQFRRPEARKRSRVLAEIPRSLPLPDREAYRGITADTLVLVAPQDPVHPLELGLRLAEYLPHARVGRLPRKLQDPTAHEAALRRAVHSYLDEQT